MLLHHSTVFISQAILCLIFAGIVFFFCQVEGQRASAEGRARWWASAAFVLVAIGRLLLLYRLPIAAAFAYTMFFVALACFYEGILYVLNMRQNPVWLWGSVTVMVVVIFACLKTGHDDNPMFGVGCLVLRGACAWPLMTTSKGRPFRLVFSMFMWLYALYGGAYLALLWFWSGTIIPERAASSNWYLVGNFALSTTMYLLYLAFWWQEMLARSGHEAVTDSLTGALNRRGLEAELARCGTLAQTGKHPFSVMLMDIDHFKEINDRLGHDAGDQAIRRVVRSIREVVRATDFVGRLGGDEILVIFPGKDAVWAAEIAQRIAESVRASCEDLHVTLSAGVAEWNRVGMSADDLLKRADMAMYQSKQAGRNRITLEA